MLAIRRVETYQDLLQEKKIQLARDMADIFEFTFQLRQKMSQLSQGQRQKVLLASQLSDAPEVLFMDELQRCELA